MIWEDTVFLHAASTACATIFLLALPFRLRRLRKSASRVPPSWEGRLKAVSIICPLSVPLAEPLC